MTRADPAPHITMREELLSNRWVGLVRTDVLLNGEAQDFYSLRLPDYVAVVAVDETGKLPLVRQYRPAVETFTWELPAGTVEPDESVHDCCRRELLEETGFQVDSLEKIGEYWPDTGRLRNVQHIFLARCHGPLMDFVPEPGVEVRLVTPTELEQMISAAEFRHLLHISALYLGKVLPVLPR